MTVSSLSTVAARDRSLTTPMDDIVMSAHPLSASFKRRLEEQERATPEYVVVASLRALGMTGALRRLRQLSPARLFIAVEDEDALAMLPVLEVLAGATRARSIVMVPPTLRTTTVGRWAAFRSSLSLVAATVSCGIARMRARAAISKLLRQPMLPVPPIVGRDVLYLNTNLWFGVKSGGSVGHIAGVANALHRQGWGVRYLAVADSPVVDRSIERTMLRPPRQHGLPPEFNNYRFSLSAHRQALRAAGAHRPSFIYQRMSTSNWTGVALSRSLNLPLVIEYNGSEVWAAKHWGRRLLDEQLAIDAERVSLEHAHLVVTVSEVLADQLADRGIPRERIVWYPNCVDAAVFDSTRFDAAERGALRASHDIGTDDIVVGFIGTFGRWHGVDLLARAIRQMADEDPAWLDRFRVRFLLVGDGLMMPDVRAAIDGSLAASHTRLVGIVPQRDAPAYLAATDILVSPHRPNPDGTAFFGSPTKLFEYMAMGKAIVASDLDQIGKVLSNSLHASRLPTEPPQDAENRLAILAEPGSIDQLIAGIRFAVEQSSWRARLGANARDETQRRYLWEHHVQAILDRLAAVAR